MSKISGEMLAEIKHGIETGEDKNGIKVDGLAYTWKQLKPLYEYISTLQNEYKTLQKRNSRQRLANQKQYELILKLQKQNEHKDKLIDIANAGITNLQQELERVSNLYEAYEEANDLWIKKYEDYKSRCEKVSEIIKKEKENMGYAKYDSCLLLIENALQKGSDSQ